MCILAQMAILSIYECIAIFFQAAPIQGANPGPRVATPAFAAFAAFVSPYAQIASLLF